MLPNPAQDLEPVNPRQHEVEQDHVGSAAQDPCNALYRLLDHLDAQPVRHEVALRQLPELGVIFDVDDSNLFHGNTSR